MPPPPKAPASENRLQSDLSTARPHASDEIPQLTIAAGSAIIVASKPWVPNSNQSDAGLSIDTLTAAISKLQIESENYISDSQENLGAPGSGRDDDQEKHVVCSTAGATNIIEGNTQLEDSAVDISRTQQLGSQDTHIKSRVWALPDPNYRAIKSWDTVSPDYQAIELGDNPSPDYREIKSWDNIPEDDHAKASEDDLPKTSDTASNTHNHEVKFSIPPAKAPLQPKAALGTGPPDLLRATPIPLHSKLTTQVPPKNKITVAAIQPLIAPNSKDIQTAGSYVIPPAFDPFKYGRPSTTRADNSPNIDGGYSRPIYGYSANTEKRAISKEPRSIVIKNLPENSTFAMVSLICKNTGNIEIITLFESLKKARVIFVHSADADKFFNEAGSGFSFEYQSDRQKIRHTVKVEMKYNINFLSSPTHTLVTKKKATRVVRIVGCDRAGLEYLVDSNEDSNESLEELLLKLAGLYAYSGVESRVEGATWRNTEKGMLEANLIYSRIKDACCAIVALGQEAELGQCTITYGKDP